MENLDIKHLRKITRYALIKIGIKCDLCAFNYICHAVELVISTSEFSSNLCELYQKIAENFNTSSSSVERSIRHAIDLVSNTKGFNTLNAIFGTEIYKDYEKPTSGELINLLAEYYNLELYKKDNMFD